MATSITVTNTFASLSGNVPSSYLDANFNQPAEAFNSLQTYNSYFADGGSTNAISLTVGSPFVVSYGAGLKFQILMAATNSGNTTINVNGIGAVQLLNPDGSQMANGQLATGQLIDAQHNGTDFILMSASGVLASAGTAVISTAGTARVTVNNQGEVTINAPATGNALVVNQAASNSGTLIVQGRSTTGGSYGAYIFAGTNASDIALNVLNQANTASFLTLYGDGHGNLGPSSSLGLGWTTGGAVNIPTPSFGVALTANAGSSGTAALFNGQVSIAAVGAIPLALTNAGSSTAAVFIDSDFYGTGSGTATFSATNKPGSNTSPTQWLTISLNGTNYYIPCWL